MKTVLKPALIAMSLGALSVGTPAVSLADHHGEKTHKQSKVAKLSPEFIKQLDHASFLPNIMKHLMMNKKKLELSAEQMKALKGYNRENSPKVKAMVKAVTELEAKAKQMTLDNFPPEAVMEVGSNSIQARHDLMLAKLKCRDFVKSVLKPEQYKQALTTYK